MSQTTLPGFGQGVVVPPLAVSNGWGPNPSVAVAAPVDLRRPQAAPPAAAPAAIDLRRPGVATTPGFTFMPQPAPQPAPLQLIPGLPVGGAPAFGAAAPPRSIYARGADTVGLELAANAGAVGGMGVVPGWQADAGLGLRLGGMDILAATGTLSPAEARAFEMAMRNGDLGAAHAMIEDLGTAIDIADQLGDDDAAADALATRALMIGYVDTATGGAYGGLTPMSNRAAVAAAGGVPATDAALPPGVFAIPDHYSGVEVNWTSTPEQRQAFIENGERARLERAAREWARQVARENPGGFWRALGRSLWQGVTFNYGDELLAYYESVRKGTDYEDELARQREIIFELAQDNPGTFAIAEFLPQAALSAFPLGSGLAALGRSAAIGAGVGGLNMMGSGSHQGDDLERFLLGGAIGSFGALGTGYFSHLPQRTITDVAGAILGSAPTAATASQIGGEVQLWPE